MNSSAGNSGQDKPLLSVLCLSYNHEAFIGAALESFAAQITRFAFEVVVADDCSSDGTLAAIERFREVFGARLRVLDSPVNLGITRNFRRALQACRGRYVALCEGDDFWRGRTKLQTQVDFLELHHDYVMSFHDATVLGRHGDAGRIQLPRRLRRDATQAQLIATRPISTLTVCFRNVLDDLPRELDHAPALDLCLWSLLGAHGKGKYLAQIEPAGYRVHAGGAFSVQTVRNRYLMTAQSLLCLARLYSQPEQAAVGNKLLLKAAFMAAVCLTTVASVALIAALLALLVVRPAHRLWLLLHKDVD